jgi:hypothetical protein
LLWGLLCRWFTPKWSEFIHIWESVFCCRSLFFGLNCKAQYVPPLCPIYSAALHLCPIASSWLFCTVELYTLVFTDNLEKELFFFLLVTKVLLIFALI